MKEKPGLWADVFPSESDRVHFRECVRSFVRSLGLVMEWDGQYVKRKKAKQKHRNSASVAGQPDRRSSVPGDWKDAISGFGEDSI